MDRDKVTGHLILSDPLCAYLLGQDLVRSLEMSARWAFGSSLLIAAGIKEGWPTTEEWAILIAIVQPAQPVSPEDKGTYSLITYLLHIPTRVPLVGCGGGCSYEEGYSADQRHGSVLSWNTEGQLLVRQRKGVRTVELPCTPHYRDLFFSCTDFLPRVLQVLILEYLFPRVAESNEDFISSLRIDGNRNGCMR